MLGLGQGLAQLFSLNYVEKGISITDLQSTPFEKERLESFIFLSQKRKF